MPNYLSLWVVSPSKIYKLRGDATESLGDQSLPFTYFWAEMIFGKYNISKLSINKIIKKPLPCCVATMFLASIPSIKHIVLYKQFIRNL